MNIKRKQKLYAVLGLVTGVGLGVGLLLYALKQNINLYYTPTQLLLTYPRPLQTIRIGGMVAAHSVQHDSSALLVRFIVTDFQQQICVIYQGVLPTLFREGQGVVVQGKLLTNGVLQAQQVLAKHDENYRPPGLKP